MWSPYVGGTYSDRTLLDMWSVLFVMYSPITILDCIYFTMWSVLCVMYTNIVIGLYILDMWSVLFVMYWVVSSTIVIGLYNTGHVVSVVCPVSHVVCCVFHMWVVGLT